MLNLANFATKIVRPKNFRFETQQDDEEILLLLRRHAITNLGWILVTIFLLALPFFLNFLFDQLQIDFLNQIAPGQRFLLTSYYYLFVFGYAFEQFLLWYYSVNVVTPVRLVDVDFLGFLAKKVSEVNLENIQDLSVDVNGVLQVTFNYGTLAVQTEGPESQVEFEDIPDPNSVQKLISNLIQEAKKHGGD